LKAAKQNNAIEWWDDTQIKPGEKWYVEIKKAIASTRIAILLVSVDYLASDFILENELPPLLAASEEEGITILPVILGPCSFKHTGLARFQSVNDPSKPLSAMNKHERDEVWNKVVDIILDPHNF
jgi:TIR domain